MKGYRIANLNHFPIVINPNFNGFSRHMELEDNSKRNQFKFVDFDETERKNISIETGFNLFMASEEQWNLIIEKLLNETCKNIKLDKNILDLFNEKFSTSTLESEIANNISFLSCFKQYFTYELKGTCGISSISIEGLIEDWKLLKRKIIELGKMDEKLIFWTEEMKVIIQEIIETLETHRPKIEFYKNIVQNTDNSCQCKPDIINGWIIKFIPYDFKGNKFNFEKGLNIMEIPPGVIYFPFKLTNLNIKGQIKAYEAEIYTGFFGIKQNKKTLGIKPVIGYAIVEVKDKKKEEEKKRKEEQIERIGRIGQLNNNMFYLVILIIKSC